MTENVGLIDYSVDNVVSYKSYDHYFVMKEIHFQDDEIALKRILYSLSFNLKFMKLAEGSFH